MRIPPPPPELDTAESQREYYRDMQREVDRYEDEMEAARYDDE